MTNNNNEYSEKGWWWQAFRDPRLVWASTTKLQILVATAVSSFVVVWCTVKGSIPSLMPELLGLYMGIVILGRAASKGMSIWEQKKVDKTDANPKSIS